MLTLESVQEMKLAHRVLAEFSYAVPKVQRGYAGQTLYVNLSTGHIEARPVTDEMKRIFVGGKGFGLWRLWHAVSGDTQWDDPENEIVIASGPIGGTTLYPGTGKSLVVTHLPAHAHRRRQQRRRLLRPAAQVRRLGCAGSAGQGRPRRGHRHRRRQRPGDHRRRARRNRSTRIRWPKC